MENDLPIYMTLNQRLSVLETKFDQVQKSHEEMSEKLDQLLELKSKGMGAIWLIGLIVGGGFMGVVGLLTSLFNRGHL